MKGIEFRINKINDGSEAFRFSLKPKFKPTLDSSEDYNLLRAYCYALVKLGYVLDVVEEKSS